LFSLVRVLKEKRAQRPQVGGQEGVGRKLTAPIARKSEKRGNGPPGKKRDTKKKDPGFKKKKHVIDFWGPETPLLVFGRGASGKPGLGGVPQTENVGGSVGFQNSEKQAPQG